MTRDEAEALADELMAFAEREGERLGRETHGDEWESLPKGPDITALLRGNLVDALLARGRRG